VKGLVMGAAAALAFGGALCLFIACAKAELWRSRVARSPADSTRLQRAGGS
jgi:hypothetical protein